jgi:excisionase family DNA binding protein
MKAQQAQPVTPPESKPRLWTVNETATFLRCSRTQLYRLIADGLVPYIRLGGHYVFRPAELEAWLDARQRHAGVSLAQAIARVGGPVGQPTPAAPAPNGRRRAEAEASAAFKAELKAIARGEPVTSVNGR